MITKIRVLHNEFSFEKNEYTNKPNVFSIFIFSHNKEVGSSLVEIEGNKFVLSELEYKNKKVLNLIYKELKNYNKKWKCNYEF